MDVRTPSLPSRCRFWTVFWAARRRKEPDRLWLLTLAVAQAAFNGPGARIPARTTDAPMAREDDAESPLPCH